ncbi:LacI family transcriptional regulator [Segetibacter sp. 3557_3]|uniref:LacI family DNA-binding transcriptional regulator n=1 Tax=Segetibacter sp. 3557_3 TaxID=2547429 RepID=UPI001058ADBE|nr:LacI family DNA-binding transcriptional regulator [Segetibacter sp. 3557_3]TDH23459.1 LacI family transcriptional regulator [Segetibacter sp. 3557_3]
MLKKEITIYDIARRLKISSATVSRAFMENSPVRTSTRKKVFDLAEQLGYRRNHFACSLRRLRSYTIGVIVPEINDYSAGIISGMEEVARHEGYNIIISQSFNNTATERAIAKNMFNLRVDGLIVGMDSNAADSELFDMLLRKNIPILFFGNHTCNANSASLSFNNLNAGYKVTEHLIQAGCRRIMHITSSTDGTIYTELLEGYKRALQKHQLQTGNHLVLQNNLSVEAGIEAARAIAKLTHLPDGIFVANDTCAVSCMAELKSLGIRIPVDIAFAGLNTSMLSGIAEPALTTVGWPGKIAGETAARKLINSINDEVQLDPSSTFAIEAELIIRASSSRSN